MTIDAQHIPPEVVEAAAGSIYMDVFPDVLWDEAYEDTKCEWRAVTRAAIAAALAAWPGAYVNVFKDGDDLILPLTAGGQ